MRNIAELDGLRGVAATTVVAFHWFPAQVFWGWSFVPLFFVLSGFLMGRILLGDLSTGTLSLRDFYIRRALRIWPVYYASLFAMLAFYLLTRGTAFLDSRPFDHWLMSLVYLQFTPLYFQPLHQPWAIFDYMPGMQHLWTLAIEEQFYLLLPAFLIVALPRLGLRGIGWCCVAIAAIAPLTRAIGFAPALLLTQADSLALGVLLATITLAAQERPCARKRRWAIAGYAAAIVIGLAMALPYLIQGYRDTPGPAELFADPLLWTDASLISFGVLGLIVSFPGSRAAAFLRSAPFAYLGSVSYALYVFHMPLLHFIKPKIYALCGPDLELLGFTLTAALLWGLVHASRELLERPFLKLKDRLAPRRPSATPAQAQLAAP